MGQCCDIPAQTYVNTLFTKKSQHFLLLDKSSERKTAYNLISLV